MDRIKRGFLLFYEFNLMDKGKMVEAGFWKISYQIYLIQNQDETSVRKDTLIIIEMISSIIQMILLIIGNDFINHFRLKFTVALDYKNTFLSLLFTISYRLIF